MKTKLKIILLNFIILLCVAACESSTQVREKITVSELPDGYIIHVKKIDSETTRVGALTGHKYGTSHSYIYQFTLSPGQIYWYGGSKVPQEIILCNREIYIHYLQLDSLGKPEEFKYVIQSHYDKHVDKRYFFNLFGEQYWVSDTEPANINTSGCKKSDISNDHELIKT